MSHSNPHFFSGKLQGTLGDLKSILLRFTSKVEEFTPPGSDRPSRLLLQSQLLTPYESDFIIWAQIDVFVKDDGSVEIMRMWVETPNDYETQIMNAEHPAIVVKERIARLNKISDEIKQHLLESHLSHPEIAKNKGGRPRHKEDIEAEEQIQRGEDISEVKKTWLIKSKHRNLEDSDRQFAAILRRAKHEKT